MILITETDNSNFFSLNIHFLFYTFILCFVIFGQIFIATLKGTIWELLTFHDI